MGKMSDMQRQFPGVPPQRRNILWTEHLLRSRRLVNIDDCAYYLMPEGHSFSIDTPLHFEVAEAIAAQAAVAEPED